MFELSLAELLLIVVVAIVFIGPKELPAVIRACAKAMRAMRVVVSEFRGAFDDLAKESGLQEEAEKLKADVRMIQGDDGQWYESYPTHSLSPEPKNE